MTRKNTDNETKFLKDFDNLVKRVKKSIVSKIGEKAEILLHESRNEYKKIIPQIPSAENREPFTRFLISTGQYLAVYRVLRRHGFAAKDAGELIYYITDKLIASYPKFLTRFLSPDIFSQKYIEKVRRGAKESQRNPIGGYVFTFINGTPDFYYGVDYTKCGVHRFLTEMGAPELTPYICATDILSSERLGWGLQRTMTIAEGDKICDFRFRKDMLTEVSSSVIKRE